jgi:hypothetical protein
MYPTLLFLHSWVRWAVIVVVLVVWARALRGVNSRAPWTLSDRRWTMTAANLLGVQFVLGVILYAVSPYTRALLDNMSETMRNRTDRFFAVEHAVVMLLAVVAAHMGNAMVRKAQSDSVRHVRTVIVYGIVILLLAYGIPWFRPLFRA